MAASKSLILKGIAGVAATGLAAVGGLGIHYKDEISKALGLEQSDGTSSDVGGESEKATGVKPQE